MQFVCVYVREAHPTDGWNSKNNEEAEVQFKQPTSLDERAIVAKAMIEGVGFTMPLVLDTMNNDIAEQYGALPNRLFIFDADGRVTYPGGIGPHAYDPEAWLETIENTVA